MAILTAFLEWKNICIGTHTQQCRSNACPVGSHAWWKAEKEVALSLLSAAIKTKRELVKRMDENSARINTEITQEMKNCTLFDKDRQVLTLFVHKTKESLKTTLRQNVMERERKKTPNLLSRIPQHPMTTHHYKQSRLRLHNCHPGQGHLHTNGI